MTVTIDYSKEDIGHMARTLTPEDLGLNEQSGWTIDGAIMEDYYEWVNSFTATHPLYGTIVGDYEDQITGDSQEALDHFIEHHPPDIWDYYDI